jgi:hypothetical protein
MGRATGAMVILTISVPSAWRRRRSGLAWLHQRRRFRLILHMSSLIQFPLLASEFRDLPARPSALADRRSPERS